MRNNRLVTWPTAGFLLGASFMVQAQSPAVFTVFTSLVGAALGFGGAFVRRNWPTTEVNEVVLAALVILTAIFVAVPPGVMLLPPESPVLGLLTAGIFTWQVRTKDLPEGGSVGSSANGNGGNDGGRSQGHRRVTSTETELIGVGGWLGVYIVLAALVGPFVFLAQAVSGPSPDSPRMVLIPILNGGAALFGAFAAYRLWKVHQPSSVQTAIVATWVPFVAGTATFMIMNAPTEMIKLPMIWALIASVLWTLYFLKSRRVKNTYYPQPIG